MESSSDEETSNKILRELQVKREKMPDHVTNKRSFSGIDLAEFSTEEDTERVLKRCAVSSGDKVKLEPKKEFDTEGGNQEEVDKSKSRPETDGQNDPEFEPDFQKDLTDPFSLKRSAEGLTEAGNNKPANDRVDTIELLDVMFESESGHIQCADARAKKACAVCKYQRRKCVPDCLTAPYFPADKERDFHNVHKLFGVNKLMKALEMANTASQKEITSKAMIFEADMRAQDPVGGCCRLIQDITRAIQSEQTQLELVNHQLEFHRNSLLVAKDEDHQMENSQTKSPAKSVQDSPARMDENHIDHFRCTESYLILPTKLD